MLYTIYGKPKIGKTTMALRGAPKGKTAVLNADDGLAGVDTEGITVVNDLSSKSLNKEVLNPSFLKEHSRIIIDTATALHDSMLTEANRGSTPTLQSRGVVNNGFATLIRTLKGDQREVIILCQEKVARPTEDWISEDEDEDQVSSVTVDLPQGAAKSVVIMSDVIGRMYMASVGDKYQRRLWLTATPGIVAGARSHQYRGEPPYLPNPTIDRLNSILGWK